MFCQAAVWKTSTLSDLVQMYLTFYGAVVSALGEMLEAPSALRRRVVGSNQASATRNYSAAIGSEHPATIRIDSRPPQHLDVASRREPKTQSDAIDEFLQSDSWLPRPADFRWPRSRRRQTTPPHSRSSNRLKQETARPSRFPQIGRAHV